MALLELKGVGVSYGIVRAVRQFDLTVDPGEVVCLLGSNGAGKTSTLRSISGVVRRSEGEIHFDGRRIDGLKPEKVSQLGLSHLPEGRGIFATLSVRENLEMGAYGANIPRKKANEEIDRVMDIFPVLRARASQLAGTLSGGEQQMLGLARALLTEPKLLMVDELSFGLAPAIVQGLFAHVAEVARAGTAVLLVEQFVGDALNIASRAYVLEKGRSVFAGSAETLRSEAGFVEEFYLGHAVDRSHTADEAKGIEEVRFSLPGRLWRDVELTATREGRPPHDYVVEALRQMVANGRENGSRPKAGPGSNGRTRATRRPRSEKGR